MQQEAHLSPAQHQPYPGSSAHLQVSRSNRKRRSFSCKDLFPFLQTSFPFQTFFADPFPQVLSSFPLIISLFSLQFYVVFSLSESNHTPDDNFAGDYRNRFGLFIATGTSDFSFFVNRLDWSFRN